MKGYRSRRSYLSVEIVGGVNHCQTVVYTVVWRNSMVWWSGGIGAMWLVGIRIFYMCLVIISRLWVILSQSKRGIPPRISNHGISPNDSVHYSGWARPILYFLRRTCCGCFWALSKGTISGT